MIPLRQREKYTVVAGMVVCGLASWLDNSPEKAMWWLVNALGVLWGA